MIGWELRRFFGVCRRNAWLRIRRWVRPAQPPLSEDGRVRVHLGCGETDLPGFWNVDSRALRHVHYAQCVFPLDVYADDSVDLIYCSHTLEHLTFVGARQALTEWHRVLRPGGVLRLAVPDFSVLAEVYAATDDLRRIRGALLGGQNYPGNFHRSVYDRRLLGELLTEVGFEKIREWHPWEVFEGRPPDTSGEVWDLAGRTFSISLNLEGRKGPMAEADPSGR